MYLILEATDPDLSLLSLSNRALATKVSKEVLNKKAAKVAKAEVSVSQT
jgi:hypothetical protein